jgi:hypothetical protein
LEIILQLIKDPCGTRKFPKQAPTSLEEKDPCQIGKSTTEKEVNNIIRIACSDLYHKSFPNVDSHENVPQHRQIPLESYG